MSDFKFALFIIIWSAIFMIFINKIFDIPFLNNTEVVPWTNNTWAVTGWVIPIIVEWTGSLSWENQTWEVVKTWNIIPDDPRGFVNYMLNNWQLNKDYFSADIYPQPITHWDTRQENNNLLFPYIWKYRYQFPVPNNKDKWYLLITLKRALAKNREVFLAIDWSSIWPLIIKKSEDVRDETEYLYPMENIPARWNKWEYTTNLFKRINNWILTLWWFVSESGNGIKNITIVLK